MCVLPQGGFFHEKYEIAVPGGGNVNVAHLWVGSNYLSVWNTLFHIFRTLTQMGSAQYIHTRFSSGNLGFKIKP